MSQFSKPTRRATMESSHGASPYDNMDQGVTVLHPRDEEACQKTKIDVVLVPGLGANPEKSWTSAKGDFSWPTDPKGLVGDNPEARILLHIYESAWTGPRKVTQSILNAADSLVRGLDARSPQPPNGKPRRPIVLVGHSMGGLVIAKAVILMKKHSDLWPNMLEAVAGAVFFGTPFRGADSAAWASIFAKLGNSRGKDLKYQLLGLMNPQSGEIHELRDDFNLIANTLQPPMKLCCFWEQEPTDLIHFVGATDPFGLITSLVPRYTRIEMVSKQSATLDGATSIGLACDHRGLVKFSGPKDMGWNQRVRAPLKKILSDGPTDVRKRLMANRNIDHDLIGKITKALATAPVDQKRNALSKTFKPSSWIPGEQEFVEWLDRAWVRQSGPEDEDEDPVDTWPPGSYIWIRGPRGRGKTGATLAAIAEVEKMMLKRQLENPDDQVLKAYFFCTEKDEYSTAEDLLKSIIGQLIEQEKSLAVYAKQFVKEEDRDKDKDKDKDKDHHPKPPARATVENLWRALHDMLWDELSGPRTRVYFLLHNLHALPRPSESTDRLLSYINKALDPDVKDDDQWPRSARWFVTSRDGVGWAENALDVKGKRLINLVDPKYEGQVQRELRMYAKTGLESLAKKKKYSRALRYLAGGQIGGRASSTQWIDVVYLLLEELPQDEDDTHVRLELEAMPQELQSLLTHSWQGFFRSNAGAVHNMKEMLRTLVLTYDDPAESELAVLAGFASSPARMRELRALVDKCKPLLCTRLVHMQASQYKVVGFASAVVKEHLMEHSKELLGLDDEEKKFQHGVITHRCFDDLYDRFGLDPEEMPSGDEGAVGRHAPEAGAAVEDEQGEDADDTDSDDAWTEEGDRTSYSVKYWLKHASEATLEVAQQLSQEQTFWKDDSPVRRRWLDEYSKTEYTFKGMELETMTSLHIACSIGYQELVDALIQEGYQDQVDVHDSCQRTPLHLAAYFDQGKIIDALLRNGANVNDQGSSGIAETPLHMAAHQGRLDVISKLTREKADPNATAARTGPVINAAICSGVEEAVDRLVECGAKLDIIPDDGDEWCSPVGLAALHWNLPMFESLMRKSAGKIHPDQYSMALVQAAHGGRNDVFKRLLDFQHPQEACQVALEEAVEEEHWEICKMILETLRGLDCEGLFYQAARCTESQVPVLEAAWNYTGSTISRQTLADSLYNAIDMEKEDTTQFLLETCHANPNAIGEEFGTALTAAAYYGAEAIVLMLLNAGANVNSPDGWALQEAAAEGNLNVAKILLDRGAEVNALIDDDKFPEGTALQGACEAAHLEIVSLLLDRNADPNLGSGPDSPPVVAAASRGAGGILEKLVNAKAEVNVFDGDGETTLLNKATSILSVESLRMLLDAGANVNLADESGNTPLMVAAWMDEEDAVELFLEYGADILHVNNEGMNAMQKALEEGSEDSLKILVDRVSGVLATLRSRRDTGSTEVAQLVRKAFKDPSAKMDDDEEPRLAKRQQEHASVSEPRPPGDGQHRCVDCSMRERELEDRARPVVMPNFYQTCVDQPPSPAIDETRTLYQSSAATESDASRQAKQTGTTHQGPGQPQGAGPSQSTPRPSNEASTTPQLPPRPLPAQESDSKQKRPPLISFNRPALNAMVDRTLEKTGLDKARVDKAMEKGKALWSRK